MAVDEKVSSILEGAARALEVVPPELDYYGSGGIDLADGFRLSIFAPPFVGFVYLAAPIRMLGGPDDKSVYRRALEINYMVTQTQGATLAIDPEANQLLLCTRLRLETLTAEILAEEISSLDAVSRKLREALLESRASEQAGDMPGTLGHLNV